MRYRDRFVPFSVSRVIQPPVLSENAEWLLAQRYFSLRYDETIASVRRESSFHEFARRVSRIVASAESLYLDADDPADHVTDPGPTMIAMKVGRDPPFQVSGLADIEQHAFGVEIAVHAG